MEHAFYEQAGPDAYVASGATAGPWSPDAQHGGPPSALAARAMELHEPDERQRLARVAIDILRPVPLGRISARTRTVRPGRRVALVETVLECDGLEVLHARGWRIERPAGDVPAVPDGAGAGGTGAGAGGTGAAGDGTGAGTGGPPELPPAGDEHRPSIFRFGPDGYLASIEWRFLPERNDGPAPVRAAWTRPIIPLLPGEEPSAMSRALLVADSGSGIGAALPAAEFIFINVDLTVVLPRDPDGDWLRLESVTTIGADGTGLATTLLADQAGTFGRGWQTLLVAPR